MFCFCNVEKWELLHLKLNEMVKKHKFYKLLLDRAHSFVPRAIFNDVFLYIVLLKAVQTRN